MSKKRILLGVTGGIAAFKVPYLIKMLQEKEYDVRVVLTESAKAFITPLTLQTLSHHRVYDALLDARSEAEIGHIQLARWADIILIAPATAHFIAQLTHGFAGDLLSTICLAAAVPIAVAPAMNQQMWASAATQENIQTLKNRGMVLLGPAEGLQACGEEGFGRLLEPSDIVDNLLMLDFEPFLVGKRLLITAGPTQEALDPVRFISNRSSGKMGYALARAARAAGADVTLVSGPVAIEPPAGVHYVGVKTAHAMLAAVQDVIADHDIFISAAAVSDYWCPAPAAHKIKNKKAPLTLTLEPTPDIVSTVCRDNPSLFTVAFAAEVEDMVAYASRKRLEKGATLIVANDVSRTDIGFDSDDNAVTVLSEKGTFILDKASKLSIARSLLKIIRDHLSNTAKH